MTNLTENKNDSGSNESISSHDRSHDNSNISCNIQSGSVSSDDMRTRTSVSNETESDDVVPAAITNASNFILIPMAYPVEDGSDNLYAEVIFPAIASPAFESMSTTSSEVLHFGRHFFVNLRTLRWRHIITITGLPILIALIIIFALNRGYKILSNSNKLDMDHFEKPSHSPSHYPSSNPSFATVEWALMGKSVFIDNEANDHEERQFIPNGAPLALSHDGNFLAIAGIERPRLLRFQANEWIEMESFPSSNISEFHSVTMSSNAQFVVLGDPYFSDSVGSVRIFQKLNMSKDDNEEIVWNQIGDTLYGEKKGDFFGGKTVISDDGTRLSIIAIQEPIIDSYIKIYDFNGIRWNMSKKFMNTHRSMAMSVNGERLITGGTTKENESMENTYAIIYDLNTFSILSQIKTKRSISSVDISYNGDFIVLSFIAYASAQMYKFNELEQDYIPFGRLMTDRANGKFGRAISLSSDGRRVAVSGLLLTDLPCSTECGFKIFRINNDAVTEIATILKPDLDATHYETSVVFSGNGNVVAIVYYGFGLNSNDNKAMVFLAI